MNRSSMLSKILIIFLLLGSSTPIQCTESDDASAEYSKKHGKNIPKKKYDLLKINKDVNKLDDHTMVMYDTMFPFMASIVEGSRYISSGALVDSRWVLTAADPLILLGESVRLVRVRLGSTNYKKGGMSQPIKLFEFHPYFERNKPNFDLALLMLTTPVKYTHTVKTIRIQTVPKSVIAAHFTVLSWPGPLVGSKPTAHIQATETIERRRTLAVTRLHPTGSADCRAELQEVGVDEEGILCLEPAAKDPCLREVGAPVIVKQVLWAVVSSWKPEDCDSSPAPVFASLVSADNISSWIHATTHGHKWCSKEGTESRSRSC